MTTSSLHQTINHRHCERQRSNLIRSETCKDFVEYHHKTNDGIVFRQTATGARSITIIRFDSFCTLAVTAPSSDHYIIPSSLRP
ncbi:hypothetical protein [Cyclobacterium jeungdonense]|uniref:Uncharacterized protein n=1 Tax=Cyclobacterium jeungdonense TaxID=708087 RepID=A0ABT8CCT3_9BACT|nr:hypothetical protein [Cyclobacterium jeungdonense]MDN3689491.1 hypothetical protein [Cyclobacterium jeungdonense]